MKEVIYCENCRDYQYSDHACPQRWECVASWYFDGETPDWSAADTSFYESRPQVAAARYAETHDNNGVLANGDKVLVYVRPYGKEGPVEVFEVIAEVELIYSASRWLSRSAAKGVA